MSWLTDPLGYDFVLRALAEVIVMGLTCGAIGAYVVVRRMAFIGDAISHAVFPGIVVAYLSGVSILLGAMGAGIVTALLIGWVARRGQIREDTAIGIFFAAAFALGIVLISTTQTYQADLTGFLIGNLQAVGVEDIAISAATATVVLLTLAIAHRPLLMLAFDPTHAAALGYRIFALDLLLLGLLTVTIVVSIQAVGIILVLAMLITPAATARLVVDRFVPMIVLGAAIGAILGVAGYYLSFHLGTASGATIVLLVTAVFLAAFVFSPTHGLLAHRLRHHPQHLAHRPTVDPAAGHAHERHELPEVLPPPRDPPTP